MKIIRLEFPRIRSASFKILSTAAVVLVMAAALAVALDRSRHRAGIIHCRNNLRRLGEDVSVYLDRDPRMLHKIVADWEEMTGRPMRLEPRGRGFWQAVRVVVYSQKMPREGRVDYKQVPMDMFDCPVNGLSARDWGKIETIDYRGPAEAFMPESLKRFDFSRPFAADRVGNHGSDPGNVLFLDLVVRSTEVTVTQVGPEGWDAAAGSTSD